jgi:3-methyladenine DNA glycosylase AlkD
MARVRRSKVPSSSRQFNGLLPEIVKLSDSLLADPDDMVRKGLGWLLRETAKFDPKHAVPYLMKIRGRAPRLVLRTACETLPSSVKRRILMRELPEA